MKIKLIIIPCLILMALGLSSFVYFKYKKQKNRSAFTATEYAYYFKYIGPYPSTYATATNSNNYALMTPEETSYLCEGYNELCSIVAYRVWVPLVGWKPNFATDPYIMGQLQNYYYYGFVGGAIKEKY